MEIYKITRGFPKEETYSLILQIRRVAVSVPSNIAEGYGRKAHQDMFGPYIERMVRIVS